MNQCFVQSPKKSLDGNMLQKNKMGINSKTFQREKDTAVSPDLEKKTKTRQMKLAPEDDTRLVEISRPSPEPNFS